jgi:hypothetical protein
MREEERQRELRKMARRLGRALFADLDAATAVLTRRAEVLQRGAARNARAGKTNGARSKLRRAAVLDRMAKLLRDDQHRQALLTLAIEAATCAGQMAPTLVRYRREATVPLSPSMVLH